MAGPPPTRRLGTPCRADRHPPSTQQGGALALPGPSRTHLTGPTRLGRMRDGTRGHSSHQGFDAPDGTSSTHQDHRETGSPS